MSPVKKFIISNWYTELLRITYLFKSSSFFYKMIHKNFINTGAKLLQYFNIRWGFLEILLFTKYGLLLTKTKAKNIMDDIWLALHGHTWSVEVEPSLDLNLPFSSSSSTSSTQLVMKLQPVPGRDRCMSDNSETSLNSTEVTVDS